VLTCIISSQWMFPMVLYSLFQYFYSCLYVFSNMGKPRFSNPSLWLPTLVWYLCWFEPRTVWILVILQTSSMNPLSSYAIDNPLQTHNRHWNLSRGLHLLDVCLIAFIHKWSNWILVATRLFHLDAHHCFFQFFSFLDCSTIYYFWQFFGFWTSGAILRP